MTYVATLHRARKEHVCDHCKRVIKPGELYVQYYEHGMGTHYWHLHRKWCARCAEDEIKKMLIFNTNKLGGYGFWFPCGKPLDEDTRRELLGIVGRIPGKWALEYILRAIYQGVSLQVMEPSQKAELIRRLEELEKQGIIDSSWREVVERTAKDSKTITITKDSKTINTKSTTNTRSSTKQSKTLLDYIN
jgi:hypothetical protein